MALFLTWISLGSRWCVASFKYVLIIDFYLLQRNSYPCLLTIFNLVTLWSFPSNRSFTILNIDFLPVSALYISSAIPQRAGFSADCHSHTGPSKWEWLLVLTDSSHLVVVGSFTPEPICFLVLHASSSYWERECWRHAKACSHTCM